MKEIKKALSHQPVVVALSLLFFLIAAGFGWEKLHYGLSFVDEGHHMTESWRLAAGDHFLRDKYTGALMLYTLLNSVIFKICPDITLLGFRKLQYFLTICSLLAFSFALFKVDKQYWYQPFVFSLFAFTNSMEHSKLQTDCTELYCGSNLVLQFLQVLISYIFISDK